MDTNEHPEHPDDVEDEVENGSAGDAGQIDNDVNEANIPVHGSEERAEELAKKAYGDKDNDGSADAPNAQFPG